VILVILWLLEFIGHFGGNLIHILILVAVIILIYNLVAGQALDRRRFFVDHHFPAHGGKEAGVDSREILAVS
jgi:hypothetical protein